MTELRLNNVNYQVADGSVFRSYYNETLDNGSIILSQISKITIKPFDEIEVYLSNQWLKFYVLDVIESVVSFTPELYNYTITYVSRTALYTKTILPNISHTTRLNQANKTIYTKLSEVMSDFGPRKRSGNSYVLRFPISNNLITFLGSTLCPEFVIQQPTLFDLFNYLLAPLNAVITINQNDETDYILLTERKTQLDKTSFSELITITRGEDYATSLVSDLQNVQNTNNEYITETGWITARSDSSTEITTPEVIVKTQHPIYKIIKLEMDIITEPTSSITNYPINGTTSNVQVFGSGTWSIRKTFDITKFVKEYSIYELLEEDGLSGLQYDANKKMFSLFYKIGTNFIGGFGRDESWFVNTFLGAGNTYQKFTNLLTSWLSSPGNTNPSKPDYDFNARMPRIRVTYIPLTNAKISVSKNDTRYALDIMVQNNQREQLVDFERFSKGQLQTVLRLGNQEVTAIKRYNPNDVMPVLGDFFDNFILYSTEVSYNDGYKNFKGIFGKDYAEKTLFSGVNSRIRLYPLVSAEEAIVRNVNRTIYCEFGFSSQNEIDFGNLTGASGLTYANFMLGALGWSASNSKYLSYATPGKIRGGVFKSFYAAGESVEYFLEPATFVGYNIIAHSFNFEDNVSVGKKIKRTDIVVGDVLLQEIVRYTDNNGELTSIQFKALRGYNFTGLTFAQAGSTDLIKVADKTVTPITTVNQSLEVWYKPAVYDYRFDFRNDTEQNVAKLPEVYNGFYSNATDVVLNLTEPIYKDNKEKLTFTLQHEFCSNTSNIVVGPSMVLSAAIIRGLNEKVNTRFFYSKTQTYKQYDKLGIGTIYTSQSFTVSSNSILLTTSVILTMLASTTGGNTFSEIKSWGITDKDGNLIIGVNKPTNQNIPTIIFLNILKTRQPL
jgi:hypothetical protein